MVVLEILSCRGPIVAACTRLTLDVIRNKSFSMIARVLGTLHVLSILSDGNLPVSTPVWAFDAPSEGSGAM